MVAPVQATAPPVGGVPVPVPPALVRPAPVAIGSRGVRTPGSARANGPGVPLNAPLIGPVRARPSGLVGDPANDPASGGASVAVSVATAPSALPPVLSAVIARSGVPASAVASAPLPGIASPDRQDPAAPSASAGPIASVGRTASAGPIALPPPPESAAPTAASPASPSPVSLAGPSGKAPRPTSVAASAPARPFSPMPADLSRAGKPPAMPPMSPPT